MPTRKSARPAFLLLPLIIALASPASALELVEDGKPMAGIILPAEPLPVETYAANELQYHVEACTGVRLPITSETNTPSQGAHVYLGRCKAAQAFDLPQLTANSYVVRNSPNALFIVGGDSRGDPLDLDTHEGTLFAVYDLLESQAHIHWLWPGKLGEVIPRQKNLSIALADATVTPLLWFKRWRGGSSSEERIWLKRQRFGRSVQPQYGHSFGAYWTRFGQTHPEYFNMLPDGTRRLDPTSEPGPEFVHMCPSNPGLVQQIIADWTAHGSPEFLNVCENDGWAGCACPSCLSWDQPDPENPIPFDHRLEAAQRAFSGQEGRKDEWMLCMGSLSDRYARFWKDVANQAAKIRSDVKVVSYVYDNYRKPPVKAMLGSNVFCGVVPQESIFGYSRFDSAVFRKEWLGWENTGCLLFLRPNYTLQAPNFPAFYARTLGADLQFAMAHSLKGVDFDSLTSKYSTEGPSLYMLARILNRPEMPVDDVLDEFYAAFGPAKGAVTEYFKLWESIYPHYTAAEEAKSIDAKRKYGAGIYGPYYLLAAALYPPEVMANAWSILNQAQQLAASDPTASARIDWLAKGLKHADLLLAAQRACERGIDTGDNTDFLAARKSLEEFRAANLQYDKTNFAGLDGAETKWDRPKH